MSSRSEPPASKGMMMIAAYRAERLRQRPILRSSLRQSHEALRLEREVASCVETIDALHDSSHVVALAEGVHVQPRVSGSVFASYLTVAEASAAEAEASTDPASVNSAPTSVEQLTRTRSDIDINTLSHQSEPQEHVIQPSESVVFDPPLAEIGFGPGMLIRLSQIGVRTTRELATSDMAELRAALGDISRLIDVEAWIGSARRRLEDGPRS